MSTSPRISLTNISPARSNHLLTSWRKAWCREPRGGASRVTGQLGINAHEQRHLQARCEWSGTPDPPSPSGRSRAAQRYPDLGAITGATAFFWLTSVQFSSVQFSLVQFSSVQFSSVQFFSAVQSIKVQFSSVQFSSV